MLQNLPKGDFRWYSGDLSLPNIERLLNSMNNNSSDGMILEVDVSYPKALHDTHNDLPYLPEKIIPPGSKFPKLTAHFLLKKNYVVHYTSLKLALEAGLILEKVHRIIVFTQSPWLAPYILLNTEMRKLAQNDFEKDFFKLMNNAVFGNNDDDK